MSIQLFSGGNEASISLSHVYGAFIFCYPASPFAIPLHRSIIPSVTMNGTTFNLVIRIPVNNPSDEPIIIAHKADGSGAKCRLFKKYATSTELKATIEPADRSIPPDMMTNVIPMAAMPTITV
jgi:hypothetical protein